MTAAAQYIYELHEVIEAALKAMDSAYLDNEPPEKAMAAAIAAGLGKWPDARMIHNALSGTPKYIKLPVEGWRGPLTQEPRT